MKIFKNGNANRYCLFAISITPESVKKLKSLNLYLEKKYKFKFGDSFISRVAIEEFLNRPEAEKILADRKVQSLVKGVRQ